MKMSFRWFGDDDPVPLEYIRQIPGVRSVVSALTNVDVGDDDRQLARIDLSKGTDDLPGWATAYDPETLGALLAAYRDVNEEQMWEHLAYFLERVVPVAASANVKLAIHPDDPPWPVFGLPRIITNAPALERLTRLVDHPANGVTFCTGSLGASADNDLPAMLRSLGARHRV